MCFNDFTKLRSVNSILQIQKPDEPTALIRLYLWQFEYLILAAQSMYFWHILECIMLLSEIAGKPILTGFCANWAPQKSAQSLVLMRFFDICPVMTCSSARRTILWLSYIFLLLRYFTVLPKNRVIPRPVRRLVVGIPILRRRLPRSLCSLAMTVVVGKRLQSFYKLRC